jgi:hypothetical protein
MTGRFKLTGQRSEDGSERWLLRLIGALCIAAAVIANHFFPDWGRTTLVSTFVFVGLMVMWRRHWAQWWFWGTMISVLFVHLLFLPQIRALLNAQGIFGLFFWAAAEAMIISAIISVSVSLFPDRHQ